MDVKDIAGNEDNKIIFADNRSFGEKNQLDAWSRIIKSFGPDM